MPGSWSRPQLGRMGARARPPAAAAGRRRHRLRRRLLTLEAARWARHVIGIDRSDEVLERAKALAARRQVTNVSGRRATSRGCRCATPRRTSRCCRRRCTTPATRSDALAEAVACCGPAAACSSSICERTIRAGSGPVRRSPSRVHALTELRELLEAPGSMHVRVSTGAHAGDPFTVLIASGTKPAHPTRRIAARSASALPAVLTPCLPLLRSSIARSLDAS